MCVQYEARSNLSPASRSRTSMPFCVRFQAAMPPAAPLPITTTGCTLLGSMTCTPSSRSGRFDVRTLARAEEPASRSRRQGVSQGAHDQEGGVVLGRRSGSEAIGVALHGGEHAVRGLSRGRSERSEDALIAVEGAPRAGAL